VVYVRTFSPPELTSLWLAKKLRKMKTVLTLGGTWLFGKPFEKPTIKTLMPSLSQPLTAL